MCFSCPIRRHECIAPFSPSLINTAHRSVRLVQARTWSPELSVFYYDLWRPGASEALMKPTHRTFTRKEITYLWCLRSRMKCMKVLYDGVTLLPFGPRTVLINCFFTGAGAFVLRGIREIYRWGV